MKKRAVVAGILAASMLLTACSFLDSGSSSRSRRNRDRDDDDGGSGFTRQTSEPTETEAPTPTPEETRPSQTTETSATAPVDENAATAAAYLEVLAEREDDIRAYDWIRSFDGPAIAEEGWVVPDDDYTCGLADITGDNMSELFIMTCTEPYQANLEIYTYDSASDSAVCLGTIDGFDVQAGGGGRYMIAAMDEGFLLVYRGIGDMNWQDTYEVYGVNQGQFMRSAFIEMIMTVDDEYQENYEYFMNSNELTEEQFADAKTDVLAYTEVLLQFNFLTDGEMIEAYNRLPRGTATYDGMVEYLNEFL